MEHSATIESEAPPAAALTPAPTIELLDVDDVCRLLGGSRPINRATLYRGMADGRFPRPLRIGRQSNRWIKAEIIAALEAAIAARDGARPSAA
jgi:predicted DNA-binding transcriptional regulator AlpA